MKKEFYSEVSRQLLFTLFDSKKERKTNSFRTHHHTELELGYLLEGFGTYILRDEVYSAGAGDLFIVRSNEQHCVPTITSDYLSSFNVYISSYYLWNICSDYVDSNVIQALINSNIPIRQWISGDPEIRQIITKLQTLFYDEADRRFEIRSTMLALVSAVGKTISHVECQPQIPSSRLKDIQSAISYLEENYPKPIPLDDIARAAAMSRSYLANTFKLVTGISPYDYLLTVRIEKAVDQLRQTDADIMTIATECGFTSTASFNKIFKKNTGLTPSELRKMYRSRNFQETETKL